MSISGFILAMLVVGIYIKMLPNSPDASSDTISEANLAVQELDDNLPGFGITPSGQTADADALFAAANDANRWVLGGFEDEKKVQESKAVIDQLIAAGTGTLNKGFVDQRIPDKEFESREVKQSMEVLGRTVTLHVNYLIEEAEFERATEIAAAQFAFGRQIFEKNQRLKARQRGLLIMKSALQSLGKIVKAAEDDGAVDSAEQKRVMADVMEWFDAIKAVDDAWNAKLKSTESVNAKMGIPNIADLTKIANDDKDPTFRVWAALRLGYARFERGDPGNQAAIKSALDKLEKSSDKQVAAAAKAGRSIKDRDEYYKLRK